MNSSTPTIGDRVTIGADPELFLVAGTELKSSIGLIGGSKREPRALGDRQGFFVQEDNVAVEFNIPPAKTLAEFCESIHWGKNAIDAELAPIGLKTTCMASALFPETELDNPAAQTFGCEPDYNAWKRGRRNPRPRCRNEFLRSCGGHIHVGYPDGSDIDKLRTLQLMDLYLGVPSVLMDSDQSRRQLYGKAGSFRETDYGFEYRVLSNFWLKSEELTAWAYTQTIRAINRSAKFGKPREDGKVDDYDRWMGSVGNDIQKAINKGNVKLSHQLAVHHDLDVR